MSTQTHFCGIDEAGRGPVIGSLFVAGVCATQSQIQALSQLGVTDSKMLSAKKRVALYDKIINIVSSYHIIEITPAQIDNRVLLQKSLTDLELDATITIVQKVQPDSIIIDCPSANKESYKQIFLQKSHFQGEVTVEFKADLNHTVVGAASILAKVSRDKSIDELKEKLQINCGSGYPSDPYTQEFLKTYYDTYPEIFRKSWESYKTILSQNTQRRLDGF